MRSPDDQNLSKSRSQQRWEIVRALLQREHLSADAKRAFRQAYPDAPEDMLNTAVFHTYIDGVGAAIDWLVELERFLNQPEQELDSSTTYHLLYHLYNWHQFSTLLPDGQAGVMERLQGIRASVADGEIEAVLAQIDDLESLLQARQTYPDFYAP